MNPIFASRLRGILRRLTGQPPPAQRAASPRQYQQWLADRIAERAGQFSAPALPGQFSLLTGVYELTPPEVFQGTVDSVLAQSSKHFEWIILAHGPIPRPLDAFLNGLGSDARIRIIRLPENLGIIGGMRRCLEEARGQYVIPLDADDLLTPDALTVLASRSQPPSPFVYSDEDSLVNGQPQSPYCRPDWDPLLNLCSSYIFHLVAFDRRIALELGIYCDPAANWCHDWDTVFRFIAAGHMPVHIPEVLYHWRAHEASQTNKTDPHEGSLQSQRHLLERFLSRRADGHLFDIKPFPIFRGAQEWWLSRKHVEPASIDIAVASNSGSARALADYRGSYPFTKCVEVNSTESLTAMAANSTSTLLAVVRGDLMPADEEWPWEAQGLFALHSDMSLLAGRIIDPSGNVLGGPEQIDADGRCSCPYRGMAAQAPGEMALTLKPHTVNCPNSAFFVARTEFLRGALARLPREATLEFIGPWLAMFAHEQGHRVGYSPLVAADARAGFDCVMRASDEERRAYLALQSK
ncbi:MAG: glycosyltransferase [Tepidisphaeraceae bacterium]